MFWVDDLRMKLVTDGVVAFMIFDIWAQFSVNARHHRDFFGGTSSLLQDFAWFNVYGALRPYIICMYAQRFCCAVTPTFSSKQRRGGGVEGKGHTHLHAGASLDKAEDNKQCILGHSDESHLRWKLTSKWAVCDPHLHGYRSTFIHSFNGGTLAGFLGALR